MSLWKRYLKKCIEVKSILTDLLGMFPQLQNIFPFFLPFCITFPLLLLNSLLMKLKSPERFIHLAVSTVLFLQSTLEWQLEKEGAILSLHFRKLLFLPPKPTLTN